MHATGSTPARRWRRSEWLAAFVLVAAVPTLSSSQPRAAAPSSDVAALALTPAEYNNTIADLLGFPRDGARWPDRSALADALSPRRTARMGVFLPPPPPPVWPWRFPAEPGAEGFEGIAQGQSPSSYQVEELHLAAMHFAAFALESLLFLPAPTGPGCQRRNRQPVPGRVSSVSPDEPIGAHFAPTSRRDWTRSGRRT